VRDHDDSSAPDHRRQFLSERVSVYDESLGPAEPPFEDPFLRGRERVGTRMLHGIMDSENRSVSAGKRHETRIVVLVNVNDLGSPFAELSSDLEQSRNRGQGSHATGDGERLNTFATKCIKSFVALRRGPSELHRV
jgi:hypothetical protein